MLYTLFRGRSEVTEAFEERMLRLAFFKDPCGLFVGNKQRPAGTKAGSLVRKYLGNLREMITEQALW